MRVQAAGRLGQAFRKPVVPLLLLFRQNHPKELTSEFHQRIHQYLVVSQDQSAVPLAVFLF